MKQFIEINGKMYPIIACYGAYKILLGSKRNSIEILLEKSYEEVKELFIDYMTYFIVNVELDEEGKEIVTKFDKSNYCLSTDITDHRDGTCSIVMAEKTPEEIATEKAQEAEDMLYDALFGGE